MNYLRYYFIIFISAVCIGCEAQISNKEGQLAVAVQAAPEDKRADAAVLGYNENGEVVKLREGSKMN